MADLYIDKGNTALKWQVVDGQKVLDEGVINSDTSIVDGLADLSNYKPQKIYVSSVASGEFHYSLCHWAKEQCLSAPIFIESTREACGVVNAYQEPKKLGVDRWLAMIAAHHKYSGLLCIVDSGTALTMDFVASNGTHLGGFIVPGAALMKSSLLDSTEQIDVTDISEGSDLGTSTSEAVILGIERMLQAFVTEELSKIKYKYQQEATLVLTGGHAQLLNKGLSIPSHLESDLVIQGLKLIAKR